MMMFLVAAPMFLRRVNDAGQLEGDFGAFALKGVTAFEGGIRRDATEDVERIAGAGARVLIVLAGTFEKHRLHHGNM